MPLEFELSIATAEPPPAGSNVTVRYPKGTRMGTFSFAAVAPDVDGIADALLDFTPRRDLLEQAGTQLFAALFSGQVLDAWRECRTLAESQNTGVRLRIFTDQPELMAVPWEYLHDGQTGQWLALDPDVSLVRGLPLSAKEPQPVEGLLRVLVMISSPTDLAEQRLAELDVEREWRVLEEATAPAAVELIRVDATYAALQAALRQQRPHLFHFIGHGKSDDQGYLLLCDETGAAEWVGADRLAPLLAGTPSLAMIFLNACQGATPATGSAFSGLAQQLLQQGLPAVLAMQAPIADANAITFSREFYAALADGLGVEGAVNAGRLAIHGGGYGWGVPACYFQSGEPFALAALTPAEKAERLWQKAQAAEGERARQLIEQVLEHSPRHPAALAARQRWEREAEIAPLYAAAQTYIENGDWRDAHRTLEQIERTIRNYRDTRSLLAQALGRLRGEELPPASTFESQYEEYRPILSALMEGRLVPFLGWDVGRVGRPVGDGWVRGQYLPDPVEAAEELTRNLAGAVDGRFSLPQVSQFTSLLEGEPALYDRLHSLYSGDYHPTLLHTLLAELPARLADKNYPADSRRRFVIFSVAFDDLLERAFARAGQPYHLFAYRHRFEDANGIPQPGHFVHIGPEGDGQAVRSPNDYDGLADDSLPVVVKLCGRSVSPEPDSVMVTEDQYLAYLPSQEFGALLPATLLREVNRRSFLFFGYSLRPWHLRLLWQRMRYQNRRLHSRSWAIVSQESTLEREFWRSQDIVPIAAQPEGVVAYVNDWLGNLEARQ